MRVLIESGLLYTFSVLILFGTYMDSNNAQFGVSDSVRHLRLFLNPHSNLFYFNTIPDRPNYCL